MQTIRRLSLAIAICGFISGCRTDPVNPSFPLKSSEARVYLRTVATKKQPLERPLIIVGGFNDPGVGPWTVKSDLLKYFDSGRIHTVTSMWGGDFLAARAALIQSVREQFGDGEVDVIGISMGGLVARFAASPAGPEPRLHVKRLFTVSSPHTGAKMASVPTLDSKVRDMRPGSEFLTNLAAQDSSAQYELIPYVRLHDNIVGEQYAAPPEINPWWVPKPLFEDANLLAAADKRIIADIVARLRGDPPFGISPAAPLPD